MITAATFIFVTTSLFIWGIYSTLKTLNKQDAIDRRLKALSGNREKKEISIVRSRVLSNVPWLNNILLNVPRAEDINHILKQAGIRLPVGVFLLFSLLLGTLGLYLGWHLSGRPTLGILGAVISGSVPSFFIRYKRIKRTRRFEKQLPDALESLCRALRAGHPLSSGIQMVSRGLPDPIGSEFGETFAEINYGVPVSVAIENLAKRVDCRDLFFIALSVGIQRDTGGNLAETLEKTAYVIRERFKLLGKVKALAAEGIYSAWILGLLPFIMAFILYLLNRDYVLMLINDQLGKEISLLALFWLSLGILVIRHIVKIKV